MQFLGQHSTCPRLLDYFVIVGRFNHSDDGCSAQDPQVLRCFPNVSHDDFALPDDIKYFCQPEGCLSSSRAASEMDSASFVFTLTDKDSGKVRYGISLNYYRLCPQLATPDTNEPVLEASGIPTGHHETLLTSLCLISHHPFFSRFRECLRLLKYLLESSQELLDSAQVFNHHEESVWTLLVNPCFRASLPQDSLSLLLVQEIEVWIFRLLSAPAPLPGCSYVCLSLLPLNMAKPLLFALPDKTRLSLVDLPLHLPLELLGVDTCLKVLTAIMLEQKVILQSRDYNALTMSVMAFTAMLYPLQYMFPAIPLLPTSLNGAENLLLSPTPYLIGIPANFLSEKKHFIIPPDVWLVDLDTNKVMGSAQLDPIPPFPYHEGRELRQHLDEAIRKMSTFKLADDTGATSQGTNGGVDLDSLDVTTRVAIIRFFNSPNILANLVEHTRTIRLYPRPVVAFQYYSFLKSRPILTPFIQRLAKTQAVEFFAEWCIYPENEVFQRIHAGVSDPSLIGDKAKWFAHALPRISFDVWSDADNGLLEYAFTRAATSLSSSSLPVDIPISQSLLNPVSHYKPPLTRGDQLLNAVKPALPAHSGKKTRPQRSVDDPHTGESPLDARALAAQATVDLSLGFEESESNNSSDMDDTDIWDLKESADGGFVEGKLQTDQRSSSDANRCVESDVDSGCSNRPNGSPLGRLNSAIATGSSKSIDVPQLSSSENRKLNCAGDHHVRFVGDEESEDDETESMEDAPVGKIILTNLSDNLADVATQATSTLSSLFNAPKRIVRRSSNFARRLVSELKSDLNSPLETQSNIVHTFGQDAQDINNSDQRFLLEVAQIVCQGRQLTSTHVGRLKELLSDENYRSYVVLKVIGQLQCKPSYPDETVSDVPLETRIMYNSFVSFVQCSTRGLENTCTNHGIGGLASAMKLLEICHTYYVADSNFAPLEKSITIPTQYEPMHNKTSEKANGENIMGTVAGWFRAAKKDLRSPEVGSPSLGRKLARPVTGLFSYANRLMKTEDVLGNRYSDGGNSQRTTVTGAPDVVRDDSCVRMQCATETELVSQRSGSPDFESAGAPDATHYAGSGESKVQTFGRRFCYVKWQLLPYELHNRTSSDAPWVGSDGIYLFDALIRPKTRSRLWDHMQFWEDTFFDTVAQERDILGFDQAPVESLKRFSTLEADERKILQNFEDRLLTTCLHNLTACMLMMLVDKGSIITRIRRIQARCRLGAHFSNLISDLVDNLHLLYGNSIKLLTTITRCNFQYSTAAWNEQGEIFALEVYDNVIIFRDLSDSIVKKWLLTDILGAQLKADGIWLTFTVSTGDNIVSVESYRCAEAKQTHAAVKMLIEKNEAQTSSNK